MKKHIVSLLAIILVVMLFFTSCMLGGSDSELVEYLESQIKDLETRVDELEEKNSEKDKEIDKLKEENSEKDKEISDLKDKNAEKDKEIGDLKDDNSSKDDDISNLESEIKKLQDEIAALKSRDAENLAKIAELEANYAAKVAELEKNKQENADALAKLEAEYKAKVEALEAENANFALQIKDLEARVQEFINNTKYTVTFDFNDEKSEIISQTIKYGKTVDEPESPKKDHYKFIGWYVNDVKAEFPYVVTSDLDFVAVYEPVKYTIKYNANGGTMPESYTTEYTAETEIILPIPYLDLFSFEGWYESSDFSGNKITKISADEYGNKTFYAKWKSATNDGLVYQPSSDGSYLIVTGYEGTETTIVIPNSVGGIPVTHIAKEAFKGKQRLVSITIPDSITTIGESAFYGCISLEELNLSNSLTAIPSYMAYECTKLSSIVIPDSVTYVDDFAFYNCINLTSIVIGNSVASIGSSTFYKCTSLESVVIPDSVTSIGSYVFENCYSLTSAVIGNSVTSIGYQVFRFCSSLTSVVIGDSLNSILDEYTFSYCTNLVNITVSENNTCYQSIDNNLYSKDGKRLIQYAIGKKDTSFEIPYGVTSIASHAFDSCSGLTSIVIPDSVTSIGSYAFYHCSSLTSVVIGDSVNTIGHGAFALCENLSNVIIGDNVSIIGESAFISCNSLTRIAISNSVTTIEKGAFSNCDGLVSVVIGESVTYIGNNAFSCPNLYVIYNKSDLLLEVGSENNGYIAKYAKIIINDAETIYANDEYNYTLTDDDFLFREKNDKYELISYIGGKDTVTLPKSINNCTYELHYMRGVKNVIIPETLNSINDYAFYECRNLTSVVIPDSVTTIGNYAFGWCKNLTSITMPNNVTNIAEEAFYGCSGINDVYISNLSTWCKVPFWTNVQNPLCHAKNFYLNGELVTELVIPDDVASINNFTFYGCFSIESIIIGDSVTDINAYAFTNCSSLTNVVIGDSVTYIRDSAFRDCSSLAEVYYNGTAAEWNSISIGSYNDPLVNATRYYYSETHPTEEGNFWHWVDGEPTVWCYEPVSIPGVDATCTTTGLSEGKYCEACGETLVAQNITDVKHNFVNNICVECGEVYYSKGLVYTSNGDGTCYLSGIGTCTDTDISIPLVSPDGDIVTGIGYSAFSSCRNITSVTIPDSVTDIGDCAFQYCDNLKEVNINNLNVHVGSDAFNRCHSDLYTDYEYGRYVRVNDNPYAILVKILNTYYATYKIHEDTYVISENSFQYHSQLTSIIIPDKVKNIGNGAFYYCSNLSGVTLGKGVTRIGEDAFYHCTSMTSINLPDGLVEICEDAFWITGLTSIVIPDSVISIGNHAFEACDYLRTVVIGNGVTDIGIWAFCGCDNLSSVIIGNSVVNIGLGAFAGCTSLKSVVMSNNVSLIDDIAFRNCPYLSKVYFDGSEEDWNSINISSDENSDLTEATRYYYSENQPTEEGNFWHWVDGEVKIWE